MRKNGKMKFGEADSWGKENFTEAPDDEISLYLKFHLLVEITIMPSSIPLDLKYITSIFSLS